MSQIDVRQVDTGFFTASVVCEECGERFATGGDQAFSAESGTRRRLVQHEAEQHGIVHEDIEDVADGDLELGR